MRTALYWLATLAVLAFLNWSIFQREQLIKKGTQVFLKLAPVDPRSLMQGDYMVLSYEIARALPDDAPPEGRLALKVDKKGVGSFARVDTGSDLGPGEIWLRYRRGPAGALFAAESYFFQEGHADRYNSAKYGELRISRNGTPVLTGLRDENLAPLGQDIAPQRSSP